MVRVFCRFGMNPVKLGAQTVIILLSPTVPQAAGLAGGPLVLCEVSCGCRQRGLSRVGTSEMAWSPGGAIWRLQAPLSSQGVPRPSPPCRLSRWSP